MDPGLKQPFSAVFLCWLCLWAMVCVPANAVGQEFSVVFNDNQLSVRARDVRLEDVLKQITQAAKFEVILTGPLQAAVTADFQELDLEEGIRRLIRGMNSVFYYGPAGGGGAEPQLMAVLILSPSGKRHETAFRPSAEGLEAGVTSNTEEESGHPSAPAPYMEKISDIDRLSDEALTEERALYEVAELADYETDQERRLAAVEALGDIGDPQAEDTLIRRALTDEDVEVRAAAVEALGSVSGEASTDFLRQALEDTDADVRAVAVETLASVSGKQSLDLLLQAIKDDDALVRSAAVEALGDIGDTSATDALMAALQDIDEEVQESAKTAIEQMGIGSDKGPE